MTPCPYTIATKAWESLLTNRYTQAGVAVVAAALLFPKLNAKRKARALAAERATYKNDVVYLYGYPRAARVPHISFWCYKVETFLRLAKIPYVFVPTMDANVSPTERLPCIYLNGQTYADSSAIVDLLTQKFSVKLDQGLSSDLNARALGITRTIQASTFPSCERAFIVDHPEILKEMIISEFGLNALLAPMMVRGFRKEIIKYLNTQGNGDLPDPVYKDEYLRDVKMLELFVSKTPFALGEKPTSADADTFAILSIIASIELPRCPVSAYVKGSKAIQDYLKRMQTTCWKDIKDVCAKRGGKQEYLSL